MGQPGVGCARTVDELDLRPVFSRSSSCATAAVVGYEALHAQRPADGALRSAPGTARAARRERQHAGARPRCARRRAAAADRAGLDAPFSLFLNADPATLDGSSLELPRRPRFTLLVEVTEQALIARPEAMLRALTRLRSAGWGIALDDVGADLRSLALMSSSTRT